MFVADDLRIDPWSSQQSTDYARIRDEFGLGTMEGLDIPDPSMLHRRGIIFAQRDLGVVLDAARRKDSFGVLTGLMPSGRMHLGHSMVIEQVKWFQSQGADVTIAVADLEAHATRGMSLEKCRENALKEYVWNYAALGLDPERTSIYFQSSRPIVQRLGFTLGKRTNLSELESIYGFRGDTNLAHVQAPMVQQAISSIPNWMSMVDYVNCGYCWSRSTSTHSTDSTADQTNVKPRRLYHQLSIMMKIASVRRAVE